MRWKDGERSENVEDRRGMRVPGGAKGLGLGAIVIALIAYFATGDAGKVLEMLGSAQVGAGSPTAGEARPTTAAEDEQAEFMKVVLKETEDIWNELFARAGRRYQEPVLVLFRDAVQSACGTQSAAVGPFYCPADSKVYLDQSFFDDLSRRHGAPGDFAQAYVIAHEIGHHVQNLLGTSEEVNRARSRSSKEEANELSVRLELQADFYAGVWAHYTNRIEAGDVEEALRAASAIGDDRLQKQAQGYAVPESFTHGTSEQRVRWFRRGYETGDLNQGDTFSARNL